jgi:hypothetical protein
MADGQSWILTQALKLFHFARHIKGDSVAHPASHSVGEFYLVQRG